MPEEITRRQFLQGSALIAGAAVVFDPSWLFDGVGSDTAAAFGLRPPRDRPGHRRYEGTSAQVEYGDGDSAPLMRWTRLGDDHTLELWSDHLVIDVPTESEAATRISLSDFDQGSGHHEVIHYFGAPTLAQLRTEVAYRRVLVQL